MKKLTLAFIITSGLIANTVYCQTPGSTCDSMVTIGYRMVKAKQYSEAVTYLRTAMKICNKDTGMSDVDYYAYLGYLSVSYHELNIKDSVFYTGKPVVEYFEKTNRTHFGIYAEVTCRLGIAMREAGNFKDAITYFEKAMPSFKNQPEQKGYRMYMIVAQDLAQCYSEVDAFEKANQLNRKLQGEILSKEGKKSTNYIAILTNIGNDFIRFSQYDSAMAYHSESLQLREELFGKKHHEYAKGLGIMASVHSYQKKISDAILLYEQARRIYQEAGLAMNLDYASLLNSLGNCYNYLSLYDKAFQTLSESLVIMRKFYGKIHPEIAVGVNNVGEILSAVFDYVQAIGAFSHAKYILEKTIGKDNTQYAKVIRNLGAAYSSIHKYDSAMFFLEQALVVQEKIYGQGHPALSNTLNSLAIVYSKVNDFNKALQLYNKILSIEENRFGVGSYNTAAVHANIALTYRDSNNFPLADKHLSTSYEIKRKYILDNTEGLSENDKAGFAEDIRLNNYVALSLRTTNSTLNNDWLYNSSLFYKGLLLEGSRGLASSFTNLSDTSLTRKAKEYLRLKAYIGQQLLTPENARSKQLPEYINQSITLERELLQASSAFRNWKQQFDVKWQPVQNTLKADEVSIEFVSYYLPYAKKGSLPHYAALMIKPGIQDPLIIPMFNEADLNKLLSKSSSQEAVVKKLYRSTIKSASSQPQPSDSLFHLIWKPLSPHIENIKTIYFAADGVLNNLNLAAIIKPDGRRLIEDYEFIQLSSTRNIIKNNPQPTFTNIQLWGGVQYDGATSSTTNRSAAFSYLPGTLTEIIGIVSTANQSNKKTKTFVADEANEGAFKNLNGKSPEVLHIATHGFFFPDPEKEDKPDNRFAQSENPLLRSGLALANANSNWTNEITSSDKEDGILTAYEIADMDLSNTKLVVLSACETGLGDVKSGEGVYGLQRAFKMAGVNYLIMSLWQVPDLETKEFMQTFYSKSIGGMPIRRAFRETQLDMNKKYQPYQWAAFVLVE
jgi:CHAT domain-containing protein